MPDASGAVALVGVNSPGYRSLAVAYLRAALMADARLSVVPVASIDFDLSTDAWWIAYRVLGMQPRVSVLAMPVMCWTALTVFEVARIVKAARPDIFVALGGPEVSPMPAEVMARHPYVDAVVSGEGEFALADLVHSVNRGGDPAGIPGVTVRDGDRVVIGPDRPQIEDLDTLPSPYGPGLPTDGNAYIETYRGCPHRCAYCFEGKGSTRIRSFGWDRIASDIEAVASTPGMRAFSFIDPVFNLTPDRLGRLSELLEPWAARGIRLHTIEVDIERVDAEAARMLARAGVVSVETGPQSVGERSLANCSRTFDAERFAAGVAACKAAGISVECDLIVGLPGDTRADVLAGIDFVTSLDPGRVQMSTLHVLPGTELWARAEELGLVYDTEPPHELIRSRDLDYGELRRLEVLGNAATAVYRARFNTKRST